MLFSMLIVLSIILKKLGKIYCMQFIRSVLFICLLSGCRSKVTQLSNSMSQNKVSLEKILSPIVLESDKDIIIDLQIKAYSLDSIIVRTDIKNNSDSQFYLYIPMLPSDSLRNEVFFVFTDEKKYVADNTKIPFNYKSNNIIEKDLDDESLMPNESADKEPSHFLLLKNKEKFSSTINLAKLYNFKVIKWHGSKRFSIGYSANMPKIVNGNQETRLSNIDNAFRPVFNNISTPIDSNYQFQKIIFYLKNSTL